MPSYKWYTCLLFKELSTFKSGVEALSKCRKGFRNSLPGLAIEKTTSYTPGISFVYSATGLHKTGVGRCMRVLVCVAEVGGRQIF